MFCPNCGTQNPDTAQTCSKCNFNVKGASQPKFKGTMLMMNQPQVPVPGAPQAPVAPVAPVAPSAAAPAPPQAASGAPRPMGTGAAPIGGANKLKGTMVGVAPMAGGFGGPGSPGSPYGAPAGAPPAAAPPVAARSAPPPAPPRTPPPPAPAPHEISGYSPPGPQGGVNPLGGTMAADVNPYQYAPPPGAPPQYGAPPGGQQGTQAMPGMGNPPQYNPYGPPPGQQQQPPAYGAPPQQGGYGAPPGPGAYGAPPVQPGYMQAPQGAYGQPPPQQQGWGPPPEYGQPQQQPYPQQPGYGPPGGQPLPGGMVPYGGGGASGMLASLQSTSGPTRRNPINTMMPLFVMFGAWIPFMILSRIPILGLLLLFLWPLVLLGCVAWLLLIIIPMVNEVKAVTRNPEFAWWPLFIPIYSIIWALTILPAEVTKAKQMLGVQQPTRPIVQYLFILPYALASDLNDMVR